LPEEALEEAAVADDDDAVVVPRQVREEREERRRALRGRRGVEEAARGASALDARPVVARSVIAP